MNMTLMVDLVFKMINLKTTNWVEIVASIVLIFGLIITIISPSKITFYIIVILSGILSGILLKSNNNKQNFKFYFVITAYLGGIIFGNILRAYGKNIWPILLFIIGITITYYLYKNKNT